MGQTFVTCSSSHSHKPFTITGYSLCIVEMLLQVNDVNRDHQAIFQAVSELLYMPLCCDMCTVALYVDVLLACHA